MIVTIDGPAGAGKSSAARRLARRLGFRFLDTGAMYRAVTLAGHRAGVDWDQPEQLAAVAASLVLDLSDSHISMNGEDVTAAIRTLEITTLTKHAADNQAVRRLLTDQQRAFAAGRDVVTEGRDQATVVFPQAECKIFLTAGEEERAKRRFLDLQARGEEVDLAEVLRKQRLRDKGDTERAYGGLAKASDSIEFLTDGLSPEEVVDRLAEIVQGVQAHSGIAAK
ncbi:(d)CMP kinase [Lacipirellula parvula]|uniref:Cytidylate kinase n=1 Tax=Lacipirellula parvula TaxID=2650471 RepID=A0A5K7X533_9BACT|nr:(d)CMP kinase [Lacipirellula parvula]BBO31804.1 cytidylate kinase [Lacipirellula parvula]